MKLNSRQWDYSSKTRVIMYLYTLLYEYTTQQTVFRRYSYSYTQISNNNNSIINNIQHEGMSNCRDTGHAVHAWMPLLDVTATRTRLGICIITLAARGSRGIGAEQRACAQTGVAPRIAGVTGRIVRVHAAGRRDARARRALIAVLVPVLP